MAFSPWHAENPATQKMHAMQNPVLALNLTTLDRILIRQTAQEQRLYGEWEDWACFMGYEPDGRLNVTNTIGHTRIYSWDQMESIEKREQLKPRIANSAKGLLTRRSEGCDELGRGRTFRHFTNACAVPCPSIEEKWAELLTI